MLLPDVNVLIYAHRLESPEHARYAEWLRALAVGPEPFALSELGASGFVPKEPGSAGGSTASSEACERA